jgi:hypothetical protein
MGAETTQNVWCKAIQGWQLFKLCGASMKFMFPELEEKKLVVQYSLEVGAEPSFWAVSKEYHYWITLGAELQELSPVLQKRWVRKRIEKEWGAPIKNPTQKRAWYEPFFSKTELENEKWYIIVEKPPVYLP